MQADVGVMLPQPGHARDCPQPPEAERGREGFFPSAIRGSMDLLTP